ncbi:hypothetical protein [Petroclostridium sp. X23]|uniref:hypothetical protein n=1 Tax=Petroclostridium sp. X23 TaxID=3045146 RepID=UPI0024AE8412|nr:hypothetical protein [Petroclostridium sp. X23]WHH60908.1 hypothetical protein QKW49_09475 [Petroclostridium sp. X23]
MSLFLGKIHYWLYNKIVWAESLEEEIIGWAKKAGLPVEEWLQPIYSRYGMPTGNKPLEEIIDTSNIHGWLQQTIAKAESRQAALITQIINDNKANKDELLNLFSKQGSAVASQYEGKINTPEDAYKILNDFILEGMPCDRVAEVVDNNDQEIVWRTTACLHKFYWDEVQGDVQNFYDLREGWIKAFVETLGNGLRYMKVSADTQKIQRT